MSSLPRFIVRAAFVAAVGCLPPTLLAAAEPPKDPVDTDRELIVTHVNVVDSAEADPAQAGGRFTIETLLANLSRDGTAKTALLDWFSVWEKEQVIANGLKNPEVAGVRNLIKRWKRDDGVSPDLNDADWQPKFANAPFRLLAIVNRFDLQKRDGDGLPLNAGEGRFVFCITDGPGKTGPALRATVIFEYEQAASTEEQLVGWARRWRALGSFAQFDASYVAALARITEKFAGPKLAPGRVNGSTLNQLRTNEQHVNGTAFWELREFRLHPGTGKFFAAATKQSPDDSFSKSPVLAKYINEHQADVIAGSHRVPLREGNPAAAFLAGVSKVPNPPNQKNVLWDPAGVNEKARFRFSFNTCNGCHAAETQTEFTHILVRPPNQPSGLSPFLRDVAPINPKTNVADNELKEITGRKAILQQIAPTRLPVVTAFAASTAVAPPPTKPDAETLALIAARANREH